MNSNADYAHRRNDDGTFDSICLRCYRTVATANTESDLVFSEAKHLCPPDSSADTDDVSGSRRNASPSTPHISTGRCRIGEERTAQASRDDGGERASHRNICTSLGPLHCWMRRVLLRDSEQSLFRGSMGQ